MDLDKEELKATKNMQSSADSPEKTADKMFDELGYKIRFDNSCIYRYVKHFKLKGAKHIVFAIDKTISVCEENQIELAVNREHFNMQELQAINQKCKELGWLDE